MRKCEPLWLRDRCEYLLQPVQSESLRSYYGGRGPEHINYNLGIQQMINRKAVLSINHAGSQTHFLGGGSGRGSAANNISPDYANQLRGILGGNAGASPQQVQSILPDYKLPFPGFNGSSATVAKSLATFPQFGTFTDI